MAVETPFVPLEAVPTDSTMIVTARDEDDTERDVLRHRTGDDVVGWLDACQHYRRVPIGKDDGETTRNGEFVCENHGAYFEADSGLCTFGPCEGARLEAVEVAVDDGIVCVSDDVYCYTGLGLIERESADRTSTSNVQFYEVGGKNRTSYGLL
ncbi:Rieske (2Fe-2S) protein [Natrialbaceae archaeon A-CW1-1]